MEKLQFGFFMLKVCITLGGLGFLFLLSKNSSLRALGYILGITMVLLAIVISYSTG
jgi:hypothetical protein